MKSDKDKVALQGIEFWSTVCDEEADLAIEATEAEESGRPPDQTSRFYVKGAMAYLVPILLETMTKQVMWGERRYDMRHFTSQNALLLLTQQSLPIHKNLNLPFSE